MADDLGYSDIGAYGSEISTPNLDALAKEGLLLTNHHTGPVCAVTRSMLISGADHHLVGVGTMTLQKNDPRKGSPGYETYLNNDALSIARLLKDAGYHTYMSGKWHLGNSTIKNSGYGPKVWGFEKSFALLAPMSQHFINLQAEAQRRLYVENGEPLPVDSLNKAGQVERPFSSNVYADKLIEQINSNTGANEPFFAYLAFTAPHFPLQAPIDYRDKYKGKYDQGFRVIQTARIKKQKENGIIPQDFKPDEFPISPSWEELTQNEKIIYAKYMEIYAAMVENLDHNIGRVVQHLKDIGEYDNTLIVFQSDNGAAIGESEYHDDYVEDPEKYTKVLGTEKTVPLYILYGKQWGFVSNTPLRGHKTQLNEGGIRSPTIIVLPKHFSDRKTSTNILTEFSHVTDLAPTLLEIAGAQQPAEQPIIQLDKEGSNQNADKVLYKGSPVYRMTGTSLIPWLKNGKAAHDGPVFGEFDGRAFAYKGQWKAHWERGDDGRPGFEWELHDLSKDIAETKNVGAVQPDILKELVKGWHDYAKRVKVAEYPKSRPIRLEQP